MPILEKDIEAKVVVHAKKLGYLARKMNGLGFSGWPDRLFIGPHGEAVFIEFKRPGGVLTAGQTLIIEELKTRGVPVFVIFDVEAGKKVLEFMLK